MAGEDKQFTIRVDTEGLVETNKGFKTTEEYLGDVAAAAKTSGKEMAEHAGQVAKASLKHGEMRQMVRGLTHAFPELGRIAMLAVHPITLAVTGIATAWKLWQYRVDELAKTLSQPELTSAKLFNPEHINAAAQAWDKYAESLAKGREALSSVSAIAKQTAEDLKAMEERWKALSDAQHAWLEEQQKKAGVPEADISTVTKQRSARESFAARQRAIDLGMASAKDFETEAKKKEAEARKIKVGSAEDDAAALASLKTNYEAAEKAAAEAQERKAEYQDWRTEGKGGAIYAGKYLARYGTMSAEQAMASEQAKIDFAAHLREQYVARAKAGPEREKLRARRTQLLDEAGKLRGQSETITQEQFQAQRGLELDRQNVRQQELARGGWKPGSVLGQSLLGLTEGLESAVGAAPVNGAAVLSKSQAQTHAQLIRFLQMTGNTQAQINAVLSQLVNLAVTHDQKLATLFAALKQTKAQQAAQFVP